MNPMSVTGAIVARTGKNFVYNLQFIPADKLDWKSAPTAKSVMEIVNHLAYFQIAMAGVARGEGWKDPQFTPATNLDQAKELILSATGAFSDAISNLSEERLHDKVDLPFGSFMLVQVASMATVDLAHHHGQIAYIQSLLGDAEDHFDFAAVS